MARRGGPEVKVDPAALGLELVVVRRIYDQIDARVRQLLAEPGPGRRLVKLLPF
jgi:hypothetical protein